MSLDHLRHLADAPRAEPPGMRPASGAAPTMPAAEAAPDDLAAPATMGRLELGAYRKAWIDARRYHRHEREVATRRQAEAAAKAAHHQAVRAAEASLRAADEPAVRREIEERLASLAKLGELPEFDGGLGRRKDVEAPLPGRIAVRLMLARLFDQRPDLTAAIAHGSPVIIIDVPDRDSMLRLHRNWTDVVLPADVRIAEGGRLDGLVRREDFDAVAFVELEPIKPRDAQDAEDEGLLAVQLALPVLALSPAAETHLPRALRDAATARLTLPRLDAVTVTRVIRIVTGKPCRAVLPDELVREVGLHELTLATRFDRSPAECLEHLVTLARRKATKKEARDLTLDELHGMADAIMWAKSTIRDLEAWRRGEIGWDEIDHAVVFNGPPGVGKTTFAQLFAREVKLPLITGSLAKWQSADEGHLGHLLRAMRSSFDEARARAPAVMFIDEVDAFPIRSSVRHSHKDYVIQVVNALMEQLDGLAGRRGLIFIAASNDVRRCDPAILRSGRLNRIIQVDLPGPDDLERMFRVRLRGELPDADLSELCLLALGSSGADVERIVKDARRVSRHADRALTLDDLRAALAGGHTAPSPAALRRAAVHEAGHVVVDVLHHGPAGVHAVLLRQPGSDGSVLRLNRPSQAGTYADLARTLQVLLAGRAAEEVVLGAPGRGSGGSETSDLAAATRLAAAMVGSIGHAGPHPLVFLAPEQDVGTVLNAGYMRVAVQHELAKAYDQAKSILTRHRAALGAVTDHLLADRRISGDAVAAIIARFAAGSRSTAAHDAAAAPPPSAASIAPADGFADPIRPDEPDDERAVPRSPWLRPPVA